MVARRHGIAPASLQGQSDINLCDHFVSAAGGADGCGRSLRALPGIAHEKSVFVKSAKQVWLPGGVDCVHAFELKSIGAV